MANSPQKLQRGQPVSYTSCSLYNFKDAQHMLRGLTLASCNPGKNAATPSGENVVLDITEEAPVIDSLQLTVSDAMTCNFCGTEFSTRHDQKDHYRSDWHRYNLKQRIKGRNSIAEEEFEVLAGNISSLSGTDTDSDLSNTDSDTDTVGSGRDKKQTLRKLPTQDSDSSSDDDNDEREGRQLEVSAQRLPKVYFRNQDGELLSLYRCVIYHKKNQPSQQSDLVSMATDLPNQMKWAVFMAGGGHFAAAIFEREKLLVHKTFHRYVVRAKRGTAQSSRDAQGNAPKSAGAALRRYNEAALKQDIKDLIVSWDDHLKTCDRIFLQAPGFNRQIFLGGKTAPFAKDDARLRLVPFQTRRPTFNEVRRVFETLATIECYGPEADIQNFVPISPAKVLNPETGQLSVRDESQLSPWQRKLLNKKSQSTSEATKFGDEEKKTVPGTGETDLTSVADEKPSDKQSKCEEENKERASSDSSDMEVNLVEMMQTTDLLEHREYYNTKVPRKKKRKKRKEFIQKESENRPNGLDGEKYHLKNALYTACKVGDTAGLKALLLEAPMLLTRDTLAYSETQRTTLDDSLDPKSRGDSDTASKLKPAEDDTRNMDAEEKQVSFSETSTPDEPCSHRTPEAVVLDDIRVDNHSTESTSHRTSVGGASKSACDTDVSITGTRCADINTEEGQETSGTVPGKTSSAALEENTPNASSAEGPLSVYNNETTAALLNEPFGAKEVTLLHVAAKEGHKEAVSLLLQAGADPTYRDKFGTTPYLAATDKSVRNVFRKFRAMYPDRYKYEKANIPAPLSEEQENERKRKEQERKKAQKKAQRERQKERKAEEVARKAEEDEKNRFLNLSDREKRALAAERRLIDQANSSGASKPVLSRCFQCGDDMTGKVPFEYMEFKFCSTKCLQLHRKQKMSR